MRGDSACTPTGGVASWFAGWRSAEPPSRGRLSAALGALATLGTLAALTGAFGGGLAAQPFVRPADAAQIRVLAGVDDPGTTGQQPADPPDPGSSWTISHPLGGVRPGTVDGAFSGTVDGIFTEGSSWT